MNSIRLSEGVLLGWEDSVRGECTLWVVTACMCEHVSKIFAE